MGGNMLDYKNIIIKRYALGLSFNDLPPFYVPRGILV